uniref:Reverse transcriptase domain-containing protein n=1 Tax=Xenopus tropicalis TaxID=8364 RepID=A0A803JHQ6_XENTR
MTQTSIFNLSDRNLTNNETKVLNKGLKFAPSSGPNRFELYIDLHKFVRQLTLKRYRVLQKPGDPTQEVSIVNPINGFKCYTKTNFYPREAQGEHIRMYQKLVQQDFDDLFKETHTFKNNLSYGERQALQSLMKDQNIVIKQADKGGGIVIQNKQDYFVEADRILGDLDTYERLLTDPTTKFISELDLLLSDAKKLGTISDKVYNFLFSHHPRIALYYHLPKVHKNPLVPPGRPIISGIDSLTSNLSDFVDHFLQDLVVRQKSYIRDTRDLLNKISNIEWRDTYCWITCDVTSLYTNIPHKRGIDSIQQKLRMESDLPPAFQTFLLDSISFILTHNYFVFDDRFYLQKQGTAMGSKFAPAYANLYMAVWEDDFIWGSPIFRDHIILYTRFIDDLLFIWNGPLDLIDTFITHINSNVFNLSFTVEINPTFTNFLDLTLFRDGTKIQTMLYRKPTDRNGLLHASSSHHVQVIKNIPKGQFLRAKRNCSRLVDFTRECTTLENRFIEKGYKRSWLKEARVSATNTDRNQLMHNNKKSSSHTPYEYNFYTKYNSAAYSIRNIIQRHWNIILADPILRGSCGPRPQVHFK